VARRRPLHQLRDNDLRLGWLDSSSDGLRANATVKRPSLTSPNEGREPAIKAKEPEVQSAGGTNGLVGGGNRFCKGKPHLWRPPPQHRRQRPPAHEHRAGERRCPNAHRQVLTPVLATRTRTGTRTGPSQNTNTALAAYDALCDPPVQPAAQRGPGRGQPAHGATDTLRQTGSHAPPQR
jgi:hypothetical protein